jgi:hypothetical protein
MPTVTRRLVLLEASKVNNQHSTLVDGILRSYLNGGLGERHGPPILIAHHTLFQSLSSAAQASVEFRSIPVMDPTRRRLVRKSLMEIYVTFKAILQLRGKSEFLLITTLLPSAALAIEILKWFLPHKKAAVMVHGDIECGMNSDGERVGSIGFFIRCWFWLRKIHSRLDVAVIDRFIAETAIAAFPRALVPAQVFVVPLLIESACVEASPSGKTRCCFVGFDTRHKGFQHFRELSAQFPEIEFVTIGAGVLRDEQTGFVTPLGSNSAFINAIGECDVAIFPYVGGYSCSLSAAATDALAAGTHLLATDRQCFIALAEEFGISSITLCNAQSEMALFLNDREKLKTIRASRAARLAKLEGSRYGLKSVSEALGDMLEGRSFAESNR